MNADSYTGDAKKFKFVMNLKFDVKVNLDSVKQYNNQGVLIKDMLNQDGVDQDAKGDQLHPSLGVVIHARMIRRHNSMPPYFLLPSL